MILVSCKNEKLTTDYNLNEFYEIEGLVYESKEIKSFLGESTWNVKYFFEINGKRH